MYKITFETFKDGVQEVEIPYNQWEDVWYCRKKFRRYIVEKVKIAGVWATNIVGVSLSNNHHVPQDKFDRLFRNKNDAIDWCIKQNQKSKVKVYEG